MTSDKNRSHFSQASRYLLSPVQRGRLFDHLTARTPELDVLQVLGTVEESLDVRAFERAWGGVFERHPAPASPRSGAERIEEL